MKTGVELIVDLDINKRQIRLTENELKQIVKESVIRILKESVKGS